MTVPTLRTGAAPVTGDSPRRPPDPTSVRYRQLDADRIVETLERLRDRIRERFPSAGLVGVSEQLLRVANETTARIAYLRRPHWPVRIAVALTIALMLVVLVAIGMTLRMPTRVDGFADFAQGVEAAINNLVFLGLSLFFLLTIETRVKRRRALRALHQLRSIVHIVDMHQLTKDPERLTAQRPDTASSPVRSMSPGELGRYLDYCSELLSLSSKVAALYAQHFNDAVILSAVNEIESLAIGFSGKVWQKITMLQRAALAESVAAGSESAG
jgi:hypothetical protein